MLWTIIGESLYNENWNPIVSLIALGFTVILPLGLYFYWAIKFIFPERFEHGEEGGRISRIIYFLIRF